MPYGPWDEYFIHQLPRPLDHVHDSDPSWSDRCYFNVHAPDASLLLVTGYGNNPNTQHAHGYAKIALADGRHWDFDATRRVVGDRGDLYAGPMRWTCIEPLQTWKLELGPNESGIEYELYYHSRAPMWELLPLEIRKDGRTIADMTHIKQSATYTGWVQIDGERHSVDGFLGGRDRTIGVRVSDRIDFWVWFSAQFEDRSIEAWVFETRDGAVQYVDGGFTFVNGGHSKRFVKFEHDIQFEGQRKRPASADIVFTDQDGQTFCLSASAGHPNASVFYGLGLASRRQSDGMNWYAWNANDMKQLDEIEAGTLSMDQLMHYRMGDREGWGIFEIFSMGDNYARYPNWGPVKLPARR